MCKAALLIRHRAKPGRRDDVQRVWEQHVKPRVETNSEHEEHYLSSNDAVTAFLDGDWFPKYLDDVSKVITDAPETILAPPRWIKEP